MLTRRSSADPDSAMWRSVGRTARLMSTHSLLMIVERILARLIGRLARPWNWRVRAFQYAGRTANGSNAASFLLSIGFPYRELANQRTERKVPKSDRTSTPAALSCSASSLGFATRAK